MKRVAAVGLLLALVAVACGGTDEAVTGRAEQGPLRPFAITDLGATSDGVLFYDASPDGQWLVHRDSDGQVCFTPTSLGSGTPSCVDVDPVKADELRWSPDSTQVVVSPSLLRFLRPSDVVAVSVDGDVTVLATPMEDGEIRDAPYAAFFVDANTVGFATVVDDPAAFEFDLVSSTGSEFEGFGPFAAPGGESFIPVPGWLVTDDAFVVPVSATDGLDAGVWLLDRETGDLEQLVDDRDFPVGPAIRPVSASDTHVLVANANRLGDIGRELDDGELFELVPLDGSRPEPIPDLDEHVHTSVGLSPAGTHVATIARARRGLREPTDPDANVVAIATVGSIEAGAPDWQVLELDRLPGSAHLDGILTSVNWTDTGLFLELVDGLVQVTYEPVSGS